MKRTSLLLFLFVMSCASAPDAEPVRLRILAYNIKHGLGMDDVIDLPRIAALIRAQNPDVVTLQEIDRGCRRSGGVDQAKVLGELCSMHHAFGPFMDYQGGQYGMALLSRFPIVESTNVLLPRGSEPRSALEARIRLPDGGPELIVTGIHLYNTEEQRLAQANTLVDHYRAAAVPVILAGDFNSERGDSVMSLLEESWANPAKNGDPNTFPSDEPIKEIDFMLVPPARGFVVKRLEVIDERVASDHRPVLLELEIPSPIRGGGSANDDAAQR